MQKIRLPTKVVKRQIFPLQSACTIYFESFCVRFFVFIKKEFTKNNLQILNSQIQIKGSKPKRNRRVSPSAKNAITKSQNTEIGGNKRRRNKHHNKLPIAKKLSIAAQGLKFLNSIATFILFCT
ncbi:hypothetical protein CXF59_13390 [Flavobacterium sp. ALD4]|nr:hypothetical protein CXF59_13390 [Flavobacterium sp. ALD4]